MSRKEQALESSVRRYASQIGYKLHKLRGVDKYLLEDADGNVMGSGYTLTLNEANRIVYEKVNNNRMAVLDSVINQVAAKAKTQPYFAIPHPDEYIGANLETMKALSELRIRNTMLLSGQIPMPFRLTQQQEACHEQEDNRTLAEILDELGPDIL